MSYSACQAGPSAGLRDGRPAEKWCKSARCIVKAHAEAKTHSPCGVLGLSTDGTHRMVCSGVLLPRTCGPHHGQQVTVAHEATQVIQDDLLLLCLPFPDRDRIAQVLPLDGDFQLGLPRTPPNQPLGFRV
jgi:hypothetical protein